MIGTKLAHYEITSHIGSGGMGDVYQAADTKLGRSVAIKFLPEAFSHDTERVARFQREARVLASLNHSNIAAIYGLEEIDRRHFLVMELVSGETLADRIKRGAFPIEEALSIAKQIAEALEEAHEKGIIHRDLKPANIKLTPEGKVKVLDFGLAKAYESGATNPSLSNSPTISMAATNAGVILGTAAYMSPEQAKGRPVDKRTDIWAFGCVLYEMLTARRAFAGDEVSDVLASVLAREPDWTLLPGTLSPVVGIYLKRCLNKDRKQRIGDAQNLRLAVEGAFETAASQVAQSPAAARPVWQRALPVAAALVAGGLLAAALTAWILWPTATPQAVSRFNYAVPSDQVFRNPGHSVVAISPGGRHFAYTANGLYLRAMNALEARLLPGTQGSPSNPFFAPDGESLGYFESGQLRRISINGGGGVGICVASIFFSGASWSRDDTILFGQPQGIMRVSANGGTPELVIPAGKGEVMYGPQLLPDGDSVLFSVTTGLGRTRWDQAQVVVQSLRTGKRTVVLRGGSDARYIPTGHLIYALGAALFAVRFDSDRLTVSGAPVSILEGIQRAGNPALNTAAANYAVSDGGTLVYVGEGSLRGFLSGDLAGPEQDSTLVWVDRAGREEPLTAPPRAYSYPRLSPDGTRVAVAIGQQGISIWDVQRRAMRRFTFGPQNDTIPVWSPDGRRLVWGSTRAGGGLNLYWQAADGTGTIERLTESADHNQRASSFTPDGQRLLLSEGPPGPLGHDIGMLSLNGDRRVTWLMQTPSSERSGEISPDGRWLAYESDESGQVQVYMRPFPAVDQGRWQVSAKGGQEPLWAQSGKELFYLEPDGALMAVAVDALHKSASPALGTPAKLIAGDGYATRSFNQLGRTYDVSPDGKRFLRIKLKDGPDNSTTPLNFVVVQNWFSELQQRVPVK